MEMSQRIHFWYQILLKMFFFFFVFVFVFFLKMAKKKKKQKKKLLVKQFCDKLKNNFELKMLKLLENHVKIQV